MSLMTACLLGMLPIALHLSGPLCRFRTLATSSKRSFQKMMTNWSPGLAFLLTGSIRVRFEHVDFFASAVTLILRLSSLAWGIRSLEDGKGIQTYNFLAQLSFRKNNVLFKWCQAHQFFFWMTLLIGPILRSERTTLKIWPLPFVSYSRVVSVPPLLLVNK